MAGVDPVNHGWWDHQISLHPPANEMVARRMDDVRAGFRDLGHHLVDLLPSGPDRTVALRALKEASMHAIGCLAVNQGDLPS